jgi:dTDP-4-amino-4,6-dideoxygalactose transaminase
MTTTSVQTAAGGEIAFHGWDRRYAGWGDTVLEVVREVADSDEFILKSRAAALERAVADLVGVEHAVAVGSGTGALVLALSALGVGPGDEVVTPAFSFISSASAVALAGANPVFADVDYDTAVLDPAAAETAVGPATRAVLPVHLFNLAAPMREFTELGRRHGVYVVEDSAVSLGATVAGAPAGGHGDAGVFSFFPGKPLGGIGDAGMVVTSDAGLAAQVRMGRNHGQDTQTRFLHHAIGWNSRMDEITAAFLLRRLPHLPGWLDRRRQLAAAYNHALAGLAPDLLTPPGGFAGRSVYSYVVRARRRAELREHLARCGVQTAVYYPRPLHLQPVFAHLGHRPGDFPVAERLAAECLALPLYPELTDAEVAHVARCVTDFYTGSRSRP